MPNKPVMIVPFNIEQMRKVFGTVYKPEQIQSSEELDVITSNTSTFDWIIDYLRLEFPDNVINDRFTLLWRLIGNKQGVVTALHNGIKDVVCGMMGLPVQVAILLPYDFYEKFNSDMLFQVGAIVHAGFCAEYYLVNMQEYITNPEGTIAKAIHKAANCEEGRFLSIYYQNHPEISPTEFHQGLIDLYVSESDKV